MMEFLTSLANSGAELGMDKILIIVFVALVILALLVGYLLGRRITDGEKKKARKAEKERIKAEKEQEKLDREAARDAEREAKRKEKQNRSPQENIPWVDTENLDDRPTRSAMPTPKGDSGIFIPSSGDDTPAVPVVSRGKKSAPPSKGPVVNRSEASAARLNNHIEANHPAPEPEQKLSRRELKKLEKEKALAEKEAAKAAKAEEAARLKAEKEAAKAARKNKATEATEPAKAAEPIKTETTETAAATKETTKTAAAAATAAASAAATAQAEQAAGPATPEEMAKRLEAILGTSAGPAVTLGATDEELPKEEVGKVELSVQPQENWAVEEAKRMSEDTLPTMAPVEDIKPEIPEPSLPTPEPVIPLPAEAPKPGTSTVPVVKPKERRNEAKATLSYGAGVESSADDVQLSSRQRKKLQKAQEEAARKEAEKAAEEEQKKKFSIFAKKKEEEENNEDEFWDENYMGEEIPDSLAGFGFTAAPAVKDDDDINE